MTTSKIPPTNGPPTNGRPVRTQFRVYQPGDYVQLNTNLSSKLKAGEKATVLRVESGMLLVRWDRPEVKVGAVGGLDPIYFVPVPKVGFTHDEVQPSSPGPAGSPTSHFNEGDLVALSEDWPHAGLKKGTRGVVKETEWRPEGYYVLSIFADKSLRLKTITSVHLWIAGKYLYKPMMAGPNWIASQFKFCQTVWVRRYGWCSVTDVSDDLQWYRVAPRDGGDPRWVFQYDITAQRPPEVAAEANKPTGATVSINKTGTGVTAVSLDEAYAYDAMERQLKEAILARENAERGYAAMKNTQDILIKGRDDARQQARSAEQRYLLAINEKRSLERRLDAAERQSNRMTSIVRSIAHKSARGLGFELSEKVGTDEDR